MSNYDSPELTGHTPRRRWPLVLTAVLALLIGGGAGYAVNSLTTQPPAPVVIAAPPAPAPVPAPAPPSGACAATAQAGAALADQIKQGVAAIQNLDPRSLRMVLDQIQLLQGQLDTAVRGCTTSPSPAPPAPLPR